VTVAERTLRAGLLDGVSVLVVGPDGSDADASLGGAVADACTRLGATVSACEPHTTDEQAMDDAVRGVLESAGGVDMLVLDGASLFTSAQPGHAALRACLDTAWNVTRAVVNQAFLPDARGGRIVYLAPAAGELVETARAGLENLARTLSVEWARYAINVVCVAPGASTAADEVATLCAYLASPAGAYFSGCELDLRGVY
jgi:NAD(P)-dependent dehydrogenase (short-subunit alcohol dehydrogenase family)